MKRLYVAIGLIVTIVALSGLALYDLHAGLTQLHAAVAELQATPAQQQQELEERSSDLLTLWNKKEERFVLYLNHGTLDHITQIVAELPALARYGEVSHLFSKADAISALLDDLWQSSLPTYRTLL